MEVSAVEASAVEATIVEVSACADFLERFDASEIFDASSLDFLIFAWTSFGWILHMDMDEFSG